MVVQNSGPLACFYDDDDSQQPMAQFLCHPVQNLSHCFKVTHAYTARLKINTMLSNFTTTPG